MAVSKVVFDDNTLVDLTGDTVTAGTLAQGETAHGADGTLLTGTYTPPVTSVNGKTGAVVLDAEDVGAAAGQVFAATLLSSGWSASAPYTQSVAVTGLQASDNKGGVDVDLSSSTTQEGIAILEAWSCVSRIYASAANTLTAVCYETAPTVDIPLKIEVIR